MGINGLLKGLKFCTRKGNVREFSGQSLVVDASSWLHKSVYSIAEHYVEAYERGQMDARCINTSANYIFKRCQELVRYAEIGKIFLVMDGKRCPLKAVTNQDREKRRRDNLKDARAQKLRGRTRESYDKYKACIKIGDDLTRAVIERVEQKCQQERLNVTFVWAPYEADAQMVRICVDGVADAIVTEDSDVLVYLAACHASYPVLYKLDRERGGCDITSMDWLVKATETHHVPETQQNKCKKGNSPVGFEAILNSIRFRQSVHPGRGVRLFVQACVLSGCDYAPNILQGVGLVTAFKQVRDCAPLPPESVFRSVLSALPPKATKGVDQSQYEETLGKSEAVFFYHPVKNLDGDVTTLLSPRHDGDVPKHVNKFYPDLRLFKGDLSFLGNEKNLVGSAEILMSRNALVQPSDDNDDVLVESKDRPPLVEIKVPARGKTITNATKPPKPTKGNTIAVDAMAGNTAIPPMLEIHVPKPQGNRTANSCVVPVGAGAGDKDCLAILKKYGRKNTVSTSAKENNAASNKPLPPKSGFGLDQYAYMEDVRFVKRDFSKERNRTKRFPSQTTRSASGPQGTSGPERSLHLRETRTDKEPLPSASNVRIDATKFFYEEIEEETSQESRKRGVTLASPALSVSESSSVCSTSALHAHSYYRISDSSEGLPVADSFRDKQKFESAKRSIHVDTENPSPGDAIDESSSEDPHSEDLKLHCSSRHFQPSRGHDICSNQPRGRVNRQSLGRSDANLRELENRAPATSHYFARKKQPVRRVTLESQELPSNDDIDNDSVVDVCGDSDDNTSKVDHDLCGLPSFDYGSSDRAAVQSSKRSFSAVARARDDWSASSVELESPQSNNSFSQPKVQTNFKPKPYRNPKKKRKSPLEQAFERQEKRYSQDSTWSSKRPSLSLKQIKEVSNSNRKPNRKQNSLLRLGFGPLKIRLHEEEDDF